MSAHSASGVMLLRAVAKQPAEYGLDYRYASLTNIVEFAVDNPGFVADAETSAEGKIKRSLEDARPGRSNAELIERRIRGQLLKVKEGLAWTELDHQLGVKSRLLERQPLWPARQAPVCAGGPLALPPLPEGAALRGDCRRRPFGAALGIEAARVESAAGPSGPKRARLARTHCGAPGRKRRNTARAGRDPQDGVS